MLVTTANDLPGHRILEVLGIVRGIVVRSPGIARGLAGTINSLAGGNVEAFTQVCEEARDEAYRRMLEHAKHVGADAIIAMRYDATEFAGATTEVLAYGTAVKVVVDASSRP